MALYSLFVGILQDLYHQLEAALKGTLEEGLAPELPKLLALKNWVVFQFRVSFWVPKYSTWVVLQIKVPFWVPNIARHPYKKGPPKGP